MNTTRATLRLMALAALFAASTAMATDGYFSHGYGMKAKGMGGAATALALAQDSFGGANNPASMVWAGSRLDLGLDWFRPVRSAERSDAGFATLNGKVDSDRENGFGYRPANAPSSISGDLWNVTRAPSTRTASTSRITWRPTA